MLGSLVFLLNFKPMRIQYIYASMFLIGLTNNMRGAQAYMTAIEFMPLAHKFAFVICMFITDGICTISTAYMFFTYRDQELYMKITLSVFSVAILLFYLLIPESP